MTVEQIKNDILKLEKALKIIDKTECFELFNKAQVIYEICESIANLKDKLYFEYTRHNHEITFFKNK
jgi:hypothetical protein